MWEAHYSFCDVRDNYFSAVSGGGKWVKAQQALEIPLFHWSRTLVLWETEWHAAPRNQNNPGPTAFHCGRILLVGGIQQTWGPAGRDLQSCVIPSRCPGMLDALLRGGITFLRQQVAASHSSSWAHSSCVLQRQHFPHSSCTHFK